MWPFRRKGRIPSKSAAYLVYAEFGPEAQIPRETRLRRHFPAVATPTLSEWLQDFDKVDKALWRLARELGPLNPSYETFADTLRREFPFMDESALRHAYNRCGFYVAREGYDR